VSLLPRRGVFLAAAAGRAGPVTDVTRRWGAVNAGRRRDCAVVCSVRVVSGVEPSVGVHVRKRNTHNSSTCGATVAALIAQLALQNLVRAEADCRVVCGMWSGAPELRLVSVSPSRLSSRGAERGATVDPF
jgi:hypothetical protein